ncbi:MAG: L,D-transpeptidase [Thermoanaerobaculales bacterium]|jgi:L,D-transpeptidase YbiS|nr:L,D-transpeptidase [Thermoanaerobaculales bacterium]
MDDGQRTEPQGTPAPVPVPAAPRRRWPLWAAAAAALLGVVLLALTALLGDRTAVVQLDRGAASCAAAGIDPKAEARATRRLASLHPKGLYVVIDTYRNRLRVYDDGSLLREAVCSTGSGTVLIHPSGERTWTFDTPLGERRVQRKAKDPVWTKPDWAFIEEGFEPPKDFSQRVDRLSLGDYALYLGDGYIIHGTLFQTLLGQGVTHGCVRLGDKDLEYVYQTIPVGARVYLY